MFGLKPGKRLGAFGIQKSIGWLLWGVILMVCLVWVTACGYRFAGSGGPPQGVEKLFIELIENKTTEPGVDILITNGLKNEFIQKYRGVLVDRDVATAVLSGVLVGIRTETVARRGALNSLERRVYMTLDLTMKSSDREQIWFARGITTSDTYSVTTGDKEATEENKRNVLQDLARRIAEISFNRLADDF
jgi:Lipopolysaccharide-assembly